MTDKPKAPTPIKPKVTTAVERAWDTIRYEIINHEDSANTWIDLVATAAYSVIHSTRLKECGFSGAKVANVELEITEAEGIAMAQSIASAITSELFGVKMQVEIDFPEHEEPEPKEDLAPVSKIYTGPTSLRAPDGSKLN